jgi:hypothetical protein
LYSHYLHIFFDICNPSLSWSPSNSCTCFHFSILLDVLLSSIRITTYTY